MRDGVKDKSFLFAQRIVSAYRYLCKEKKEFVLSKQLLRCGTSIGANVAEAQYAVSGKDFLNKHYIALKECAETLYWIDLLTSGGYLSGTASDSLRSDCEELRRLLSSITKTMKENKLQISILRTLETSSKVKLLTPHS